MDVVDNSKPGKSGPSGARRIVGAALRLPPDDLMTIPALLMHVARARSGEVALRCKRRGFYREVTWSEAADQITRIALGLHSLGIGKGDRVAIVGDPLPEWLYSDFAVQCLGAISYGLYPTSSREEIEFTLRHGGASMVIAEDQEHIDKVMPLLGRLPSLRRIVVIDTSNIFNYQHEALMSLVELTERGRQQAHDVFARLIDNVQPDDPAAIVYTSGSSADPKGAVYTHRALITQGHQFFAFPELADGSGFRSVVHLPLNHLYERMNTPMGMLVKGIVPHFGEEVERFLETLAEVAPQHHASVPRYWSKLASRVIVGVDNSTWIKRASYRVAMRVGHHYRRRRWSGRRAPVSHALYAAAQAIVFDRMLRKLGLDRVRVALSAGAPLPTEVQALWQVWGVNLKNMYGQTEGGVLTAQFDSFPRPGSVGRAYPGGEIRLGPDDEIIVSSSGHFSGYWSDPKTTAEVLQPDGIRTGDIGTIDEDGVLSIIDRKKDILITAGGKNVSPSRIETALKSSPYITEASVVGERRKYLTALIEVDVGTVSEWARTNDVPYSSYQSLATNAAVFELIASEVERINAGLGRVEQIKAFRILDRELDPEVEGEAVTATRKIKRSLLQKHFAHMIRDMYSDEEEKRIERQLVKVE